MIHCFAIRKYDKTEEKPRMIKSSRITLKGKQLKQESTHKRTLQCGDTAPFLVLGCSLVVLYLYSYTVYMFCKYSVNSIFNEKLISAMDSSYI